MELVNKRSLDDDAQKIQDISANKHEVVYDKLDNLKEILKTGSIAKFDVHSLLTNDVLQWSLKDWSHHYGSSLINLHTLKSEEKLVSYLNAKGLEGYLDFKKKTLKETPIPFANQAIKISTIIERMNDFKDAAAPLTWYSDINFEAEMFTLKSLTVYGVVNAKTIPNFHFPWPEIMSSWSEIFNFLWFGRSIGGLHIDIFDNTLIQLHGKKEY